MRKKIKIWDIHHSKMAARHRGLSDDDVFIHDDDYLA